MARAGEGMLHRGGKNGAEGGCGGGAGGGVSGGDEVARSLELLDQVLSEFEEGERSLEPAPASLPSPPTPLAPITAAADDDSPLAGHTSEDDGYMSMNGRRAKFALGFRPTEEREEYAGVGGASGAEATSESPPQSVPSTPRSPPPPEEAQRIIANLLPLGSPATSANGFLPRTLAIEERLVDNNKLDSLISVNGTESGTQSQTTFPKTRHQRPYGWEKEVDPILYSQQTQVPPFKFSSLQHGNRLPVVEGCALNWLPPRHHRAENSPTVKKSPSTEVLPVLPFMGFSSEFAVDKPYNEHPVTIYPGPNKQYNKQSNSSNLNICKVSPSYTKKPESGKRNTKRDSRSDGETLSPRNNVAPKTFSSSMENHRDVCRSSMENSEVDYLSKRSSKDNEDDHFSDDSLEEPLPPPPPQTASTPSKRNSIAWEVSLDDDDDPLLTPGSTKVVGRRRRKSGDNIQSSSNSIPQRLDDDWTLEDYWPPPPANCSTEEDIVSPFSDTESEQRRSTPEIQSGTYVIRKGKSRKQLPAFIKSNSRTLTEIDQSKNHTLNKNLDIEKSFNGSTTSITASANSSSRNSLSSYTSRPSSDLSGTHSRHSIDLGSRIERELITPSSRYSIDLGLPNKKVSKAMASPKSRLSLDLNNSNDRFTTDRYCKNPNNIRSKNSAVSKGPTVQNKLSPQNRFTDFKKYSSTFDNIKSLIKEGKVEDIGPPSKCNEVVPELPSTCPNIVRVVSLPTLAADNEEAVSNNRQALITTVEEEEDMGHADHNSSEETSPLRKIENNINAILSQGRDQKQYTPYPSKDWNIHEDEYCDGNVSSELLDYRYSSRERPKRYDIQKSSSHNEIQGHRSMERRDWTSGRRLSNVHKSPSAKEMRLVRQPSSSDSAVSSSGDFPVNVQIVEHSFRNQLPHSPGLRHDLGPLPQTPESPKLPPLPPSPVQEVDDEYTEILQPSDRRNTHRSVAITTSTSQTNCRPFDPPEVPPHRGTSNSLKTRSMEGGYSKNKRMPFTKCNSVDRRTLPNEIAASGVRRRTLQRQRGEASAVGGGRAPPLQTSASLPETPIFARGCDLPRTPLHQTSTSLGPRQSTTMNSFKSIGGSTTLSGYGRGSVLGPASCVTTGADLLRMGGPARGWYPRQRHRPASTEHLDRLGGGGVIKADADSQPAWDGTASRKPLTLPPNLTPKFFQKSPREALRRVTSLLIRKGNNPKEKESDQVKEATSPAARSANGDEHPRQKQRKGFFKSLWKRSRHYSLEHP